MTLDELRERRRIAWLELVKVNSMKMGLEPTWKEILAHYQEAKAEYEHADHDLALVDGRLHVEEPATSAKSKRRLEVEVENFEFTEEAIERMAAACGVSLPAVEEEPLELDPGKLNDLE